MSSSLSSTQRTILALRSGGVCAVCRFSLTVDSTNLDDAQNLGYAAHIKGEKQNSARYDALQPDHERNSYPNLLYTCGRCHPLIDKQSSTYTVAELQTMKQNHEKWVIARLSESSVAVGFTELDLIAKGILGKPHDPTLDFAVLTPEAKMQKNGLGSAVLDQLRIGYGKAPEVTKYVNHVAAIDVDFPERLKAGFVGHYNILQSKGLTGDDLFFALHEFASQGSINFMRQAAALSILTYLFQSCEVFEH